MKPVTIILSKLAHLIFSLLLATSPMLANALPEEDDMETSNEGLKNTVYFPQFQMFETVKNEEEMSDEISGRLYLVDECLRLVTRQESYLLIWPGWYDFTIAGREIVVSKINTNTDVAYLKIGDRIRLTGAEIVYFPPNALQYKIPEQCLGPFLAVGEISSVKAEVEINKEKHPLQKKAPKLTKDVKIATPLKKKLPKRPKRTEKPDQQLKKLEIILDEKELLK